MRKAVLTLLVLVCCNVFAGTKRALVVFIGDYPEHSGWNRLASGNDMEIVLKMLSGNGFKKSDIICLYDAGATCGNILGQLKSLAASCRPGDQVYVHFSCHGQQITDLDGDEALSDPSDRYDEAIVPYDACIAYNWNGYKGENHLTDDSLNSIFASIAKKIGGKGCLLVINDACHSGGIEREDNAGILPPMRGAWDAFEVPLSGENGNPAAKDVTWVSFSACKSFQTNWECCMEGKMYGRLSYAVSRCFHRGITPEALGEALAEQYRILPMPEGKVQSVQMAIPANLSRKRMFVDE